LQEPRLTDQVDSSAIRRIVLMYSSALSRKRSFGAARDIT
jgi:hypothetical protein